MTQLFKEKKHQSYERREKNDKLIEKMNHFFDDERNKNSKFD